MIHCLHNKQPDVRRSLFIAWNAEIAGDVYLAEETSVWFSATIRGDLASIYIGRSTNIQDGTVIHVDADTPVHIGESVTIGHGAIIHGCTIEDRCVIGMGAIILNRAVIPSDCIIGAGSLVTEGKVFPAGSLILGTPAKVVRNLSQTELAKIKQNAEHYIEAAIEARNANGSDRI